MMKINCGGVEIKSLGENLNIDTVFSEGIYSYRSISLQNNQEYQIERFNSAIILLISGRLYANDLHIDRPDEIFVLEKSTAILKSRSEDTVFLVVGTDSKSPTESKFIKSEVGRQKKVEKPWGYEIWISGEHPAFCFKKIVIKAGYKTSLQYHNYKTETNLLINGTANLYFKKNTNIDNLNVSATDIGKIELKSVSSIDVKPGTLHRIEALSDICLYEVSTPEVDDVIRVSDDSNRPSGRILAEHKNAK